MFDKKLEEIDENYLNYLVQNEFPESKMLEYKRDINDKIIEEICAFANTDGGYIIIGIEEGKEDKKGKPISIIGINDNIDLIKQQIENRVRDTIFPRLIPSIDIKAVPLTNGKNVIIIKVNKSLNFPHMVGLKTNFYLRTNSGIEQMEITQLKNAFLYYQNLSNKIKEFRLERISNIVNNNTPITLKNEGKMVLHLIPIFSFEKNFSIDLEKIYRKVFLSPIFETGYSYSSIINLNGILTYSTNSYLQLYRNGIIETVSDHLTYEYKENLLLRISMVESEIKVKTKEYIEFLKNQDILFPYLVLVSLINVKNTQIERQSGVFIHNNIKCQENLILLPDVIINEELNDINSKFELIINILWNAYGFPTPIRK